MAVYRKVEADIFEALNNAQENGYFDEGEQLYGATPEYIADDLILCSEGVSDFPRFLVIKHVKAWLADRDNLGE